MAVADRVNVDNILQRSFPILTPRDTRVISNGFTSLENAFNIIVSSITNINNIQKAQLRSDSLSAREISSETRTLSVSGSGSELLSQSPFNIQPFILLTKSIQSLERALSKLDLSKEKSDEASEAVAEGGPDVATSRRRPKVASDTAKAPSPPKVDARATTNINRAITSGVKNKLRVPPAEYKPPIASNVTKSLVSIALGSVAGFGLARAFFDRTSSDDGAPGISDMEVSGSPRDSFATIMDIAAAAGAPHPEVVAAQWALESGWGKKMSGKNNPFGQKATKNEPGTTKTTREFINGRYVTISDKFKDYATIDAAIQEHVNRWNKKYTTKEMTPLEAIQAIKSKGYATDPQYVSKIANIIAKSGIDPSRPFKYEKRAADTTKPGTGRVTSVFGMRTLKGVRRMHYGTDIGAQAGTDVFSVQSGTVIEAGKKGDYGQYIKIKHGGDDATAYAHLSRIDVRKGQFVSKAQIIGAVGSTGRSTGPHLHFELFKGDNPVDSRSLYENNTWIVGGQRQAQNITPTPASFKEVEKQLTTVPTLLRPVPTQPKLKPKPATTSSKSGFTGADNWKKIQMR